VRVASFPPPMFVRRNPKESIEMSADPLEKQEKYPREVLEKYFGPHANGKDAQELFQKFPDEYHSMRREYLGPTKSDDLKELLASKQPPELTGEDLAARAKFSLADVKRFLVAESTGRKADNIMALSAEDRETLRRAALTYGLPLPQRTPPATQPPAPVIPEKPTEPIPEKYRVKFNYPVGAKATPSGLLKMAEAFARIEAAEAAAAKEAADQEMLAKAGLRRTPDGKFERIAQPAEGDGGTK